MRIKSNFPNKWRHLENVALTGILFNSQGQMLDDVSVASYFNAPDEATLTEKLKRLNGYWGIAAFTEDGCLLAVDRIRSCPLFYSMYNGTVYISSDANWILAQIDENEIDEVAKVEFLMTGFIPGNATLSPHIKQVQAGSYVYIKIFGTAVTVDESFYYQYSHTKYYEMENSELLNLFDGVINNIFTRIEQIAKGRQLVIPLSGGYDSRYIVLMLKRMGYNNIVTYTYGKVGGEEAKISRYIAQKLGVPWYFVEYTADRWRSIYSSETVKQFYKYTSNLNSLPHMQDYPAIMWLKENVLSDDAVFLPGISADLNTGGFFDKYPWIYNDSATFLEDLKRLILYYSYELAPWNICDPCTHDAVIKRLDTIIESQYSQMSAWEAFERWVAVEKVAKFVLNSVRAYEFAGFDWWTPYWDIEFVDFWYNVPLRLRKGQTLYLSYLKSLTKEFKCFDDIDPLFRDGMLTYNSAKKVGIAHGSFCRRMLRNIVVKSVKSVLPNTVIQKIKKQMTKDVSGISGAYFDTLLLTLYPEEQINALVKQGYKLNGIVGKHYMKTILGH